MLGKFPKIANYKKYISTITFTKILSRIYKRQTNMETQTNTNTNKQKHKQKQMQSEIDIADVLLDYSDLLPNFPYLPDTFIRELKLSEFYEALSGTSATSEEVELLRVRRRRLQKSHFKQKYDQKGRVAFSQLERSLEELSVEKEELIKLKSKLQTELEFYKDSLGMEV